MLSVCSYREVDLRTERKGVFSSEVLDQNCLELDYFNSGLLFVFIFLKKNLLGLEDQTQTYVKDTELFSIFST